MNIFNIFFICCPSILIATRFTRDERWVKNLPLSLRQAQGERTAHIDPSIHFPFGKTLRVSGLCGCIKRANCISKKGCTLKHIPFFTVLINDYSALVAGAASSVFTLFSATVTALSASCAFAASFSASCSAAA